MLAGNCLNLKVFHKLLSECRADARLETQIKNTIVCKAGLNLMTVLDQWILKLHSSL